MKQKILTSLALVAVPLVISSPVAAEGSATWTSLVAPSWTGKDVDYLVYVCNVDDTKARNGVLIWDEEARVFKTEAPINIKIETNRYERMRLTFPNAALRSTTGGPDIPIANWRSFQIDTSDVDGSFLEFRHTHGITYTTSNLPNPANLDLRGQYRKVPSGNNGGQMTMGIHFEVEPENPELVTAATSEYKLAMVLDCYELDD